MCVMMAFMAMAMLAVMKTSAPTTMAVAPNIQPVLTTALAAHALVTKVTTLR